MQGFTRTDLRFHHSQGDTHSTHQYVGSMQDDTPQRNQTTTRCTSQDSVIRPIPIAVMLHGQGQSGGTSDDGLGSKMDFVILIVRLIAGQRHNLLLSNWVKLLDRRVMDMTAITTTQAGRAHLPIWALQV